MTKPVGEISASIGVRRAGPREFWAELRVGGQVFAQKGPFDTPLLAASAAKRLEDAVNRDPALQAMGITFLRAGTNPRA